MARTVTTIRPASADTKYTYILEPSGVLVPEQEKGVTVIFRQEHDGSPIVTNRNMTRSTYNLIGQNTATNPK